MNLLEPWKDMADDIIEIPDGAGLSDHTRSDLVELWTSGDDSGFHDPYSPVRILLQYQLQSRRFSLAIHSLCCRPSYWGTCGFDYWRCLCFCHCSLLGMFPLYHIVYSGLCVGFVWWEETDYRTGMSNNTKSATQN